MMVNQHIELLVLDDWGLQLLSAEACRDPKILGFLSLSERWAALFHSRVSGNLRQNLDMNPAGSGARSPPNLLKVNLYDPTPQERENLAETSVVSLIPRTVAAQFWFPKWPLADTRDNRCGRQPGSGG